MSPVTSGETSDGGRAHGTTGEVPRGLRGTGVGGLTCDLRGGGIFLSGFPRYVFGVTKFPWLEFGFWVGELVMFQIHDMQLLGEIFS